MASFLALGECMVEIAPAEGDLCRLGFAGDTFNTAWYARQLLPQDWTVGYGSCIGDDAVSNEMAAFIESHGVDTSAMRRLADRTVGLYMISLQDGERSFSYWRGQSAARAMAEDPAWLEQITKDRDVIHFSGITLAILPPDQRQTFCDVLARARAAGAKIAFDTNLRPKLWGSEEAMRTGLTLGASVADVVLPSFDEETALFGDATPADTITRYRDGGATLIAVKDGGNPLTVWSQETGTTTHQPQSVTPVDTTAAGDSFAAGLLASLATGHSLDDAADRAMALAAQVIQARGALVPEIFEKGTFS
ncbi:sugar kinase [Marinovum sp. 2_MG-2023]|uniref:sugar kinase n=1 Tax=unclassified Marinovum TaxID=2647166 RepID=UPI0026E38C8A|nr:MULTISPECIES: sugar kinase [unclassified Marinovum]MDO6732782.1 sugar kinase [Marinovum sp. 2_MG-2023]MDO6781878.1 sugar kinase [Marinovum sp. 1_MG-2023]